MRTRKNTDVECIANNYQKQKKRIAKRKKYGKTLILVDRFYPSSKTCISCGYIHKDLALSDRVYVCPQCGNIIDRDWQAALNIQKEGLRIYYSEIAA